MEISENLQKIEKMFNNGLFHPYIKYIEFSFFKNFKERSRISFNHPITVLVGGNGTNKSSILKALESCCPDKIISNRWFSTDVDSISHDPVPQFWYAHDIKSGKETQEAQVLVAKYKRDGQPDYWEKARPLTGLGMTKIPNDQDFKKKWEIKTRWPQIKKDVLYLTFRETISAFDKFFYYGDAIEKFNQISSRKKHIRKYSKYLNKVIKEDLQEFSFRNKPKVIRSYHINPDELKYISDILELNYSNIKVVEHSFFHCSGITCKIYKDNMEYSEAFAGSGEFAVIKIVHEILNSIDKSLIVLDEPEVSLHPGAQERLMSFLVEQCKLKKIQIVLATHSPILISKLPNNAIKTLFLNRTTNEVEINDNGCKPEEAFWHLGYNTNDKIRFIVEDKLAQDLVYYSTEDLNESQKSLFIIEYYNGGAFDILNNFAVVYALEQNYKCFIYLDGDQRSTDLPEVDKLNRVDLLNLEDVFNRFCHGTLTFPKDSNMSDEKKIEQNIKILKWLKTQVIFLPTNGSPEQIIWDKYSDPKKNEIDEKYSTEDCKCKFTTLTRESLPKHSSISSEQIHFQQLQILNSIAKDDQDIISIRNKILEKIGA